MYLKLFWCIENTRTHLHMSSRSKCVKWNIIYLRFDCVIVWSGVLKEEIIKRCLIVICMGSKTWGSVIENPFWWCYAMIVISIIIFFGFELNKIPENLVMWIIFRSFLSYSTGKPRGIWLGLVEGLNSYSITISLPDFGQQTICSDKFTGFSKPRHYATPRAPSWLAVSSQKSNPTPPSLS